MSKYMSVKEAAEQVGVSTQTVRRWIQSGALPALRISARLYRLDQEDFEKFIQSAKGKL